MKINIAKIITTAFGAGFSPFAPGTMGALVGILFWWLLHFPFINLRGFYFFPFMVFMIILVFFIGVWASNVMEPDWGHDPGKIVVDEVIGQWIALLWIPFSITNFLLAFALFRFFDILKPLFIKKMEALPSGWGVMADDVLAGIYANIVLQVILWSDLLPH